MHIHIYCPDGEAKYWMEPVIELAYQHGLSDQQLSEIKKVTEDHQNAIIKAWNRHFRD